MESTYSIDEEENLVRIRIRGEITVDGLIRMVTRITDDPRFRLGMNAVTDMRESFGSWDFSESQRCRDFLRHIAGDRARRWALVVKPGTLVGIFHVLIVISEPISHRIRMRLFEDVEPAFDWATGKVDLPGVGETPECPGAAPNF